MSMVSTLIYILICLTIIGLLCVHVSLCFLFLIIPVGTFRAWVEAIRSDL